MIYWRSNTVCIIHSLYGITTAQSFRFWACSKFDGWLLISLVCERLPQVFAFELTLCTTCYDEGFVIVVGAISLLYMTTNWRSMNRLIDGLHCALVAWSAFAWAIPDRFNILGILFESDW